MSRTKGGTNRYWSNEEKLRIINKVLVQGISSRQVAREENISDGMLCNWMKKYLEQGESALENKKKTRKPISKILKKKKN